MPLTRIKHCIIAPSLPAAHHAIMARGAELGFRCDRVLFPWELIAGSPAVRQGVIEAAALYLQLHDGEDVHIFTRPGYAKIAGEIADAWYAYGLAHDIPVFTRIKVLSLTDEEPTTLVWACGDGRPIFWRAFDALHRRYGSATRIITPPGEEQWITANPSIAREIEAWVHEQKRLRRIVAKHGGPAHEGGCGYRRQRLAGKVLGTDEERAQALAECCDPYTEYLWLSGNGGDLIETLRAPLRVVS